MHVNISNFEIGKRYSGAYICKQKAVKQSRTGSNYLDMTLTDKTGDINGKCWNIPSGLDVDTIEDGGFVAVAFTVEEYNGRPQVKIENLRALTDEDTFDRSEIVPCAPRSVDDMFAEIISTINDLGNEDLQKLCLNVIMENKSILMKCPGAKSMHHAVISGLLQHITGMLRLGKAICSVYPNVNQDIVLAGIILHDICKPREFVLGPVGLCTDYTTEGKLLGHITMGVAYLTKKCEELHINKELSIVMEHMILSHHGEPDYGSAVRPMFIEAVLLNNIDNIDAKINMATQALEGIPVGSFSEKVYGMDNIQLYNHGIKSE